MASRALYQVLARFQSLLPVSVRRSSLSTRTWPRPCAHATPCMAASLVAARSSPPTCLRINTSAGSLMRPRRQPVFGFRLGDVFCKTQTNSDGVLTVVCALFLGCVSVSIVLRAFVKCLRVPLRPRLTDYDEIREHEQNSSCKRRRFRFIQ